VCVLLTRHFLEIRGYPVQFVVREYSVAIEHLDTRDSVCIHRLVHKAPVTGTWLHLVKKTERHCGQLYQALQVSVQVAFHTTS